MGEVQSLPTREYVVHLVPDWIVDTLKPLVDHRLTASTASGDERALTDMAVEFERFCRAHHGGGEPPPSFDAARSMIRDFLRTGNVTMPLFEFLEGSVATKYNTNGELIRSVLIDRDLLVPLPSAPVTSSQPCPVKRLR